MRQNRKEIRNTKSRIRFSVSLRNDLTNFANASHFKATEYRLLLLYVLADILKNRLSRIRGSLSTFHATLRSHPNFSCKKLEEKAACSMQFLEIYGDKNITDNIHNLLNLAYECRRIYSI